MLERAEHVKVVCGLYRRALRWAFDWHFDVDKLQRTKAAIRMEFDRYKSLTDPKEIDLVMDACRYILWSEQHPQPYKCTCLNSLIDVDSVDPSAPGGTSYERHPRFPEHVCLD